MLADALNPLYEQITQDGFIAAFEIYAMLLNKFVNPILISILGIAAVASILISLFNGIAVQAMISKNMKLIGLFILFVIVANTTKHSIAIAQWLSAITDKIAMAICQTEDKHLVAAFVATIDNLTDLDFDWWEEMVVSVFAIIMSVVVAGSIIIVKVVSFILFAIAPAACAMLVFSVTRPIIANWAKYLLNYQLQLVLIAIVMRISLSPINAQVGGVNEVNLITICTCLALFGYFVYQVTSLSDVLLGVVGSINAATGVTNMLKNNASRAFAVGKQGAKLAPVAGRQFKKAADYFKK